MNDLLIIYVDGSEHTVHGVTTYGYKPDVGHYHFTKNGWVSFIPREQVRFIGRWHDYYNEGNLND